MSSHGYWPESYSSFRKSKWSCFTGALFAMPFFNCECSWGLDSSNNDMNTSNAAWGFLNNFRRNSFDFSCIVAQHFIIRISSAPKCFISFSEHRMSSIGRRLWRSAKCLVKISLYFNAIKMIDKNNLVIQTTLDRNFTVNCIIQNRMTYL